jgi:hypothetical protein
VDHDVELAAKFNLLPCGTQNQYTLAITCSQGPFLHGACCKCSGGCDSTVDVVGCYNSADGPGTFFDVLDNSCPGICASYRHGCSDAIMPPDLNADPNVYTAVFDANPTNTRPPSEDNTCAGGSNDSAWYKFVVPPGVDSLCAKTCDTTQTAGGRDSVIGFYCGKCCDVDRADRLGPNAECDDDSCGFNDLMSRETITGITGTAYDKCKEVDGSHTIYMQISHTQEPNIGTFRVDIGIPCTGSCCNPDLGPMGGCQDGVEILNCLPPKVFSDEVHCSCVGVTPPCTEFSKPCGEGACCTQTAPGVATCTNEVKGNDCVSGNFYHGAVCRDATHSTGYVCNIINECDYVQGPPTGLGLASQLFTDLKIHLEAADNFLLKGSGSNACEIDQIAFQTFHTNHDTATGCLPGGAGAGCLDKPTDYVGIVVVIISDIDGDGPLKGPICLPKLPVTTEPPFHVGVTAVGQETGYNPDCFEYVFGVEQTIAPPATGNYWSFGLAPGGGGQAAYINTMHFDPQIVLQKNKKYWVGISPIMPLAGKYQTIWSATNAHDGNLPRFFSSTGTHEWDPVVITPVVDMNFSVRGTKVTPQCTGPTCCGPCRLYTDMEAFFCLVDISDLNKTLTAYTENPPCSTTTAAGITPGSLKWNGGCPLACTDAADCVISEPGGLPAGVCVGGLCCGLTDISEVLVLLATYSGTFNCPHLCAPGACNLPPPNGGPNGCCRDGSYFPATTNNGTTESDCVSLFGAWLGTGTTCSGALPPCP